MLQLNHTTPTNTFLTHSHLELHITLLLAIKDHCIERIRNYRSSTGKSLDKRRQRALVNLYISEHDNCYTQVTCIRLNKLACFSDKPLKIMGLFQLFYKSISTFLYHLLIHHVTEYNFYN